MTGNIFSRFRQRLLMYKLNKKIKKEVNEKTKPLEKDNKLIKASFITGSIIVNSIIPSKKVELKKDNKYIKKTINIKINKKNKEKIAVKKEQRNYNIINRREVFNNNKELNSTKKKIVKINKAKGIFIPKKKIINKQTQEQVKSIRKIKKGINIEKDSKVSKETNKLKYLENSIINQIEKRILNNLSELELIETDLFLLTDINDKENIEKDCKDKINKLNILLEKINKIKEEFKIIKDNYLEDSLYLSDDILSDKISEYRALCNKVEDIKNITGSYKKLAIFETLENNIDILTNDTKVIKNKHQEALKQANLNKEKFNEMKNALVDIKKKELESKLYIEKQTKYLKQLTSKISKIDEVKTTQYKLVGLNTYIKANLKYISLILLSPLSSLIPSIGISTLTTKRMITKLKKKMEFKEINKIYYIAENYENEINYNLNNLFDVDNLIYSTLVDIKDLKFNIIFRFSKYQNQIKDYDKILKNIDLLEQNIIKNQIKINKIKNNLKDMKKQNKNKLIKVKELNSK